jgi:hypothetical protein
VWPHPGWAALAPPSPGGLLDGLGSSPCRCFAQILWVGWAFFSFLSIKSALRFVWRRTLITFYMYSMFMP